LGLDLSVSAAKSLGISIGSAQSQLKEASARALRGSSLQDLMGRREHFGLIDHWEASLQGTIQLTMTNHRLPEPGIARDQRRN
jgi:hypothetical protein